MDEKYIQAILRDTDGKEIIYPVHGFRVNPDNGDITIQTVERELICTIPVPCRVVRIPKDKDGIEFKAEVVIHGYPSGTKMRAFGRSQQEALRKLIDLLQGRMEPDA